MALAHLMLVRTCRILQLLLLVLSSGSAGAQTTQQLSTASFTIPVYIMLPLEVISNGTVQDPAGLRERLGKLKAEGVAGVMLDVWWGLVEQSPQVYHWEPYLDLVGMVRELGLKMEVIMSFHSCGGNVGDSLNIPLPEWLGSAEEWGYKDQHGSVDKEYISLFYDRVPLGPEGSKRTPVEMYRDYMQSFQETFAPFIGPYHSHNSTIVTIEVGLGPAGELRYPSYRAPWTFPGVGEFQCYDSQALKSLSTAAESALRPDWASPPNGTGNYNSMPEETTFFSAAPGHQNFGSKYGKFFLSWYSQSLVDHSRRVLAAARDVFDLTGAKIDAKVAGIHWHYKHPSHAAELTAGYYNLQGKQGGRDGYAPIASALAGHGAGMCFTCLEMLDNQQPEKCNCSPEALVAQTHQAAFKAGISYSGENALPRYDMLAYDTVKTKSWETSQLSAFTYLRYDDYLFEPGNFENLAHFVDKMRLGRFLKSAQVAAVPQIIQKGATGFLQRVGESHSVRAGPSLLLWLFLLPFAVKF